MVSAKDVVILYETLLTAPGMNEVAKIDLRVPRKNVLLLAQLIGAAVDGEPPESIRALFSACGPESLESIRQTAGELLGKAGLTELNAKLQTLREGK